MAGIKKNYQSIALHLFVYTVYLTLTFCDKIRTDLQLSEYPYDYDVTPEPLEEFTPSIGEIDLYTPSSTVEDSESWLRKTLATTESPDVWWKRFTPTVPDERDVTTTKEPYVWRPFDEKDMYIHNNNFDSNILIIVVALVFMFMVFGAGGIYCIKRVNRDINRNTIALAVLTVDSGSTIPHHSGRNNNTVPSSRNIMEATPNLNNAIDKPPSYEVVVLSQLDAQPTIYPEVNTRGSECPPPKYEDNVVQKY